MEVSMRVIANGSRLLPFVPVLAAGLLVLPATARAQLERRSSAALPVRTTLGGSVVMPDGSPAAGALVVSSAGGEALTDADGRFALALELPDEVASIEVTASAETASGSLVARASVVPAALTRELALGPLALTHEPSCGRWLPTFGPTAGLDGTVYSLATFDDGDGPELYAGGHFARAGSATATYIARWDGVGWSA